MYFVMNTDIFYNHLCAGRVDKIYKTIVNGKIDIEHLKVLCRHESDDFFERIALKSTQRWHKNEYDVDFPVQRLGVLTFLLEHVVGPVTARVFLHSLFLPRTKVHMWALEQNAIHVLLNKAFVDRTLQVGPAQDSDWILSYQHMIACGAEVPLKWLFEQKEFARFLESITPSMLYNSIAGCAEGGNTVCLNTLLEHVVNNPALHQLTPDSHNTVTPPAVDFSSPKILGGWLTFTHIVSRFPEKPHAWTEEQRNRIPVIVAGIIKNRFANALVPLLLHYSDPNVGNDAFVQRLNALKLHQYSLGNTETFLHIIQHRPHLLSMETSYTWQGKYLTVYDLCFHKSSIEHFHSEDDKTQFHKTVQEIDNVRQNTVLQHNVPPISTARKRSKL